MVYIKSYPATKTELHKNSEAIRQAKRKMFKRKSRKISKYKTEESDYSPQTTTLKLKRNPDLLMQTPFHHHNHARREARRGHLESRVTQGYTIDMKGKQSMPGR